MAALNWCLCLLSCVTHVYCWILLIVSCWCCNIKLLCVVICQVCIWRPRTGEISSSSGCTYHISQQRDRADVQSSLSRIHRVRPQPVTGPQRRGKTQGTCTTVPVTWMNYQDLYHEFTTVALMAGQWTCDSQVMGLSLDWAPLHTGLRQATYTCVPLSLNSIIWYRPRAMILLAGKITPGLVESNNSLPPDLWPKSLASWLPRNWDQVWAQHS